MRNHLRTRQDYTAEKAQLIESVRTALYGPVSYMVSHAPKDRTEEHFRKELLQETILPLWNSVEKLRTLGERTAPDDLKYRIEILQSLYCDQVEEMKPCERP